ncbi:MAG: HPr family phosphocarrier protein [Acidobacteriota bacterium]
MIDRKIVIINKLGMHARAAAKFVHLASRFKARINIVKDGQRVDGKSILGILMLAAAQGSNIRLIVEGNDEREAFKQLEMLIKDKFGEEE